LIISLTFFVISAADQAFTRESCEHVQFARGLSSELDHLREMNLRYVLRLLEKVCREA
jgi:hypothetical protein